MREHKMRYRYPYDSGLSHLSHVNMDSSGRHNIRRHSLSSDLLLAILVKDDKVAYMSDAHAFVCRRGEGVLKNYWHINNLLGQYSKGCC